MIFNGQMYCLLLLFFFLLAGIVALVSLRLSERTAAFSSAVARSAVQTAALLSIFLLGYLIYAFVNDKFSLAAVAQYSSRDLPTAYKISAVWAGASGSLFLWSVILFVFMAVWTSRAGQSAFEMTAIGIGSILCAGFAALLVFVAKPFAFSSNIVENGMGLNPLLRNFWMTIHPPLLFLGYSGFLLPFVLMVSGVFAGEPADQKLYQSVRKWFLFAFFFLTLGIVSGAKWAYVVLGWGGFWGWDPVENASLLPWLVALAGMHTMAVSRRSGKFITLTTAFVTGPFLLCLVATSVTRSGILQSVHAFGENPMGKALMILIAFVLGLWLVAVFTAGMRMQSRSSEAGWFVPGLSFVTALILLFTAAAVAVATFWPAISGFLINKTFTVGRVFYDRVASVAAIALVVLVIVGGIANWKTNNRVRMPGVIISHIGMILLVISIGIGAFTEKQFQLTMAKGIAQNANGYEFTYTSFKHVRSPAVVYVGPEIELKKDNKKFSLWPHRSVYDSGQAATEVTVRSGLLQDIYMIFDGIDENNNVLLVVLLKPMMLWLWVSMLMIAVGAGWMYFK